MIIHIDDHDLSVYRLVQRVQSAMVISHRRTMNVISHGIEDVAILQETPLRIFSSFQRMSKFVPQVKRYERIAQSAEVTYVFGVPDVEPPPIPGVHYVYLNAHDRLAREWFLVAAGDGFASALVTEELSHIDDPDEHRRFRGLWTFSPAMIGVLYQWLANTVDTREVGITDEPELDPQQQHFAQEDTVARVRMLAPRSLNDQEQEELRQTIAALDVHML